MESLQFYFFSESKISMLNMENVGLSSLETCSLSTLSDVTDMSLAYNNLASFSNRLYCMIFLGEDYQELQITSLNLKNNRIRTLEFLAHQFPNLVTLNLEWNAIETLNISDFQDLSRLKNLNVGNNRLISIEPGFFQFPGFKQLNLSSIGLDSWRHLDLGDFHPNVELIDLSLNRFDSVRISKTMPKLKTLMLRRANLTGLKDLDPTRFANLAYLDLSENPFEDISSSFNWSKLTNLAVLSLSRTNVHDIDSLFAQFGSFDSLDSLNLSYNSLRSLGPTLFRFGKIKTLDFSNNQIEEITGNALSKKGSTLYLQNNKIRHFPYIYQGFSSINLANNLIQAIEVDLERKTTVLNTLDLRHNRLESLRFENIFDEGNQMFELYLGENLLTTITAGDFNFFKQLVVLDLNSNRIEAIEMGAFGNMDRLVKLNLAVNNLTALHVDTFKNQLQLESLNLSCNRLEFIAADLFSNLFNVQTLDVSHNSLRSIDDFAFKSLNLLETILLDVNHPALEFPTHAFAGLDSIRTISIEFGTLSNPVNRKSLVGSLSPIRLKMVGELAYFRSISLIYTDVNTVDCQLVLSFLKNMIQVNLRSDYDFDVFNQFCSDVFLY